MPPTVVNRYSITVPFDTYEGIDPELMPDEDEAATLRITGGITAKNRLTTNATINANAKKRDDPGHPPSTNSKYVNSI